MSYEVTFEGNKIIGRGKEVVTSIVEFENTIKKYEYHGEGLIHDDSVERSKLPPFVVDFYYLYADLERVPTDLELLKRYMETHYDKELQKYSIPGIEGRLLRSYPSYLRDYHFYLMCLDSKLFYDVKYSLEKDVKAGIDVSVKYCGDPLFNNGNEYHVKLFTSEKGQIYAYEKDFRCGREILKNGIKWKLVHKKRFGIFDLYDDVELLGDKIKEIEALHNTK